MSKAIAAIWHPAVLVSLLSIGAALWDRRRLECATLASRDALWSG